MLGFVAIIAVVGFIRTNGGPAVTSRLAAPSHPLSKPEPHMLLKRGDLSLSPRQRSSIQDLEAAWVGDKATLLNAMSGYQPREGRSDQITGSLQGYSELSRTFDAIRSQYWAKARGVLDARQKLILDGGTM